MGEARLYRGGKGIFMGEARIKDQDSTCITNTAAEGPA